MIAKNRVLAAAATLAAVTTAAACSSSSAGSTGGTRASAPQTAKAASPTTQAAPAPNALSVTAHDSGSAMSFDVSGSPRQGLVRITFTNAGKYAHEMGISMMKPGVTLAHLKTVVLGKNGDQKAQALLQNPDAEYPVPSILGPGRSEVDAAKLPAGHYVVICFLPGADGMPHVAMGMIDEFTVTAGRSTEQPPQTQGTVELSDKGITVPAGFGAGGTFEVKNTGSKPHDFSLAQLAGKTLPDLFQCVEGAFGKGTPIDKCPGTLAGGVNTLQPGESAYLTMTLPAGKYGYLSTEGDGADLQAGLVGTFSV